MKTKKNLPFIPERFRVSPATLLMDRLMTGLIMVGGVAIIVAVFFIFVFIGFKVAPLFRGAEVAEGSSFPLPERDIVAFGIDEWREVPYFLTSEGEIFFVDLEDDSKRHKNRGIFTVDSELPDGFEVADFRFDGLRDRVVFSSTDGRILIKQISFVTDYGLGTSVRMIQPEIESLPVVTLGRQGYPVVEPVYSEGERVRLIAGIQLIDGGQELHLATLTQRRTPFGVGPLELGEQINMTEHLRGEVIQLLIPDTADALIIGYASGEVDYFRVGTTGKSELVQTFQPMQDLSGDGTFHKMEYIFGDQTIIFFNKAGDHNAWNLAFIQTEEFTGRRFVLSKEFESLPLAPEGYAVSRRNKTFLTTAGNHARLTLMTTMADRWRADLDFTPRQALIAPRYDALLFLDTENNLHTKEMVDDHPIAGMTAYFSKIQYEGRPGRITDWQSDGGADFERKLSMIPLIIGTLKGTVYAMFIAVPVALLSAVYVSQFLRPGLKKVVKPTMEIMASLPSVILGFFAGMWLSPLISNAVPSVMLSIIGLFLGAVLMGLVWSNLPNRIRLRAPSGLEFVIVLFPAMLVGWIGWQMGQVVENWMFVQYDDVLNRDVGSFRMWVVQALGWDFETRNALVVGFAMGFAVIPIIFTISEDSLSNVPNTFKSGSLALGASRWQTAMRIIVPTAAAGIFSALMIGFGRAIGETMIMVMATGNSVVQDFNPFTGMRTLSANIAVEISEAEQNGTLYRTLFFCAFLLFVFTFTLNTIAEVLRQWLRKKYRAVE
ncbi:MAG: ABC transporter permease subunit [Puniceicoccaceae bacterium]|nr:MAG: ABC transporter permease subunit [Puniceicoccaceae bacterium]